LTDWATGKAQPADVVRSVPIATRSIPGSEAGEETAPKRSFTVISAGSVTPEPAEVLASPRFRELVQRFREVYDLTVFDCAPLLSVGDALEVLPLVDAALLCVRLDQTTREQALAAKAAIGHMPKRPIGLVVTGVRSGHEGYYSGYYSSTLSRPAILVQPPGSS
jgi:Mrp family chromosome partitioning ATPase